MRTCLHRYTTGQFDDERAAHIYAKANKVCSEFFKAFPDVDLNDLFVILISQSDYAKAFTLVKEALPCNQDCKECPSKTFDSDSSQSFICDKTGRVVG